MDYAPELANNLVLKVGGGLTANSVVEMGRDARRRRSRAWSFVHRWVRLAQGAARKWDQRFESALLQQRVSREPRNRLPPGTARWQAPALEWGIQLMGRVSVTALGRAVTKSLESSACRFALTVGGGKGKRIRA